MVKALGMVLFCALLAVATGPSAAADDPAGKAHAEAASDSEIPTAPVEIDGNVLFRVRGTSSLPAAQRAAAIQGRIEALAQDPGVKLEAIRAVSGEDFDSIVGGDRPLMAIADADGRVEQVGRRDLASVHAARIRTAVDEYRRERAAEVLLRSALYAAGATVLLAAALWMLLWMGRRMDVLIDERLRRRVHAVEIQSFEIVRAERIRGVLRGAHYAIRAVVILAVVLTYLQYLLGLFPWTRGLANHLVDLAVGPLATLGKALLAQIPDLVFLAILWFVVRFILRMIRLFFDSVARGAVRLEGFEADWAGPTYKIVRFAVIALALIVAYPYIPGSESAAFKGVSLFIGVLFSLGSSSAIANIIAGYMMTYRRAFRVGDRVKIGDVIGDVTEMRLQVTHLRTLKNEEVTVPNAQIANGQVVNYSSIARTEGLILHTTVGIGYETPWRQVEAMLLMASTRTPGLAVEPAPFVLQTALGDFAVTYELNVYCKDAQMMNTLYTALHRNILDVFNEYAVAIMTPAYRADPSEPKIVPKAQWHAAPAAPDR